MEVTRWRIGSICSEMDAVIWPGSASSGLRSSATIEKPISRRCSRCSVAALSCRNPMSSRLTKTSRRSIIRQSLCRSRSTPVVRHRSRMLKRIEQRRPTSDITNFADAICMKAVMADSMPAPDAAPPSLIVLEKSNSAATRPRKVSSRPRETNVFGRMRNRPGPKPRSSTFRKAAGRTELRRRSSSSMSSGTMVSENSSHASQRSRRGPARSASGAISARKSSKFAAKLAMLSCCRRACRTSPTARRWRPVLMTSTAEAINSSRAKSIATIPGELEDFVRSWAIPMMRSTAPSPAEEIRSETESIRHLPHIPNSVTSVEIEVRFLCHSLVRSYGRSKGMAATPRRNGWIRLIRSQLVRADQPATGAGATD